LFVHCGLYAILAGVWEGEQTRPYAEWIMKRAKMSVDRYEKLTTHFTRKKYNSERWVRLAKQAGMKYIVITAKHHDGFSLFDSKFSAYDAVDATPRESDPLKALAEACEKHDIKLGFYYSIMEWHHYDYLPSENWQQMPKKGASLDRYQTYLQRQVRELLNNYGDVAILWFDGE
jgi:alpha-L-fucosidase